MAAAAGLDLSGLYRSPVFHSQAADPSHQELSKVISKHGLTWGRGRVNTTLFRRDISRISVMILGYGAEVEIQADGFQDFSLVQMPLRGVAEFISDGCTLTACPGEVAILSPRQQVRTLWQGGCEQLILKVPHALFDGASAQDAPTGVRPAPAGKIDDRHAPQWAALIRQLLSLSGSDHPAWLRHVETGLALFLLCHGAAEEPAAREQVLLRSQDRAGLARLRQAQAYVLGHLHAPISLADLAGAAGLSPRALHILCRRHHGESPMNWARNLRLEAARRCLLADPRVGVTEVALAHGFGHLGRFSAYYQARFGELPSATGRRAPPGPA